MPPPSTATIEEVAEWVASLKLSDLKAPDLFRIAKVDGRSLPHLTLAILQAPPLSLALGDAIIVEAAIKPQATNAAQQQGGQAQQQYSADETILLHVNATKYSNPVFFDVKPAVFVDRVRECTELAVDCVKAILSPNLRSNVLNNSPTPTTISAQMWGSGKSFMGYNFIRVLNKGHFDQQKFVEMVSKDDYFKDISMEEVNQALSLLKTKPSINLDLCPYRNTAITTSQWIAVICTSLYRLILTQFKQKFEATRVIYSLSELIKHAPQIKDCFVHLDEIDMVIKDQKNTVDSARALYQVWNSLTLPLVSNGIPVYLTGRSPILFSINHGSYRNHQIMSPEKASINLLLLNMFTQSDILTYLTSRSSLANPDAVSKAIHKMTLGVPRLVNGVVDYLASTQKPTEVGLRAFLRGSATYSSELNPTLLWQEADDLPKILLYLELCRASIFQIPFDLNMIINLKDWGIPSMYDNKGVPLRFADFFQMLNVYLDRFPPNPTLVVVVIPSLTLSEIIEESRRKSSEKILRIGLQLQSYLNLRSNTLRPTGIPFEDCVEAIIEIRTNRGIEGLSEESFWNQFEIDTDIDMDDGLFPQNNAQGLPPPPPAVLQTRVVINQSISQLFLFLMGTWIGDILWRGDGINRVRAFPKIVRDPENLIHWDLDAMMRALSTNRVDVTSYPQCPMRYFKDLWKLAQPFTTYRSAPKSGSSDFYTKINDSLGVAWVVKDVKQPLSADKIQREIQKVGDPSIRFVMVVVSMTPPAPLGYPSTSITLESQIIGTLYSASQTIQIITLTTNGLKYFFSEELYKMLLYT